MIAQLINRPCVIIARTTDSEDEYGNETTAESLVETVCELQQTQRSEQSDRAELSETTWTLFFLPDTDVQTNDTVVVGGESYELTGDPWEARNPRTGVMSHIEATARRTAGPEDAS